MQIANVVMVVAVAWAYGGVDAAAGSGSLHRPTIDGLRDCPNGGIILPGSSTCLRLGGSIRAETTLQAGVRRSLTRPGTSAIIAVDARAPTELGPVRIYTSVRIRDGSR